MKKSAGILVYRKRNDIIEFFLAHPGGPYWQGKDINSWSIPKGEINDNENPFDAAKREFKEETGFDIDGEFFLLPSIRQSSGKLVTAWAVEGDLDETKAFSNTFQFPPDKNIIGVFPEMDDYKWFPTEIAKEKIFKTQIPLIDGVLNTIK